MYTIDNFLEIKKEIYEYCTNLTVTRSNEFIVRHKYDADDLFQKVFLISYETLPKIKKEILTKSNYLQIIKNITYWSYIKKYNKKLASNKITENLTYYQDTTKSEFLFEKENCSNPEVFTDIFKHPDFKFITRNLNTLDLEIVNLILKGYSRKEIMSKFNISYARFNSVLKRMAKDSEVNYNISRHKRAAINDIELLKSKVGKNNFNKLNLSEKNIKIFSMYLQGYSQDNIAEAVNMKKTVVAQYIYRIKSKLKLIDIQNDNSD